MISESNVATPPSSRRMVRIPNRRRRAASDCCGSSVAVAGAGAVDAGPASVSPAPPDDGPARVTAGCVVVGMSWADIRTSLANDCGVRTPAEGAAWQLLRAPADPNAEPVSHATVLHADDASHRRCRRAWRIIDLLGVAILTLRFHLESPSPRLSFLARRKRLLPTLVQPAAPAGLVSSVPAPALDR